MRHSKTSFSYICFTFPLSPTTFILLFLYPSWPYIPPLPVLSAFRAHLFRSSTSHIPFLSRFMYHVSFTIFDPLFQHLFQNLYCRDWLHYPVTPPFPSYQSSVSLPQLELLNLSHPFISPLHVSDPWLRTLSTHSPFVMGARESGWASGSDRCATYMYPNMNERLNDICTVINGKVPNDVGENSSFVSSLCRWSNTELLSGGAFVTDKRAIAYRSWVEQQLVDHVTVADFWISANHSGWCSLHIALCTAGRGFQFHTTSTMKHLFNYISGITTDIMWLVLERAEALRSGAVQAHFLWTNWPKAITGNFSYDMILAMDSHRIRQKNDTSDISVSFQLNGDAQILLYIVLFRALNYLSYSTFKQNLYV